MATANFSVDPFGDDALALLFDPPNAETIAARLAAREAAEAELAAEKAEIAEQDAARAGRPMPLGGKTYLARVDFSRARNFPIGDARGYQGPQELEAPGSEADPRANCVTSLVYEQGSYKSTRQLLSDDDVRHMPALDLDIPVEVYPSTQPGHWHVYFHKEMSREHYMELLAVMSKVGLIEPGFALASQIRGYSALRMPWVKKSREEITQGEEAVQNAQDRFLDPA